MIKSTITPTALPRHVYLGGIGLSPFNIKTILFYSHLIYLILTYPLALLTSNS